MVYIFIGIGGVLGSLLRYCFSLLGTHFSLLSFPIATATVNLTGSFLLGWLTGRILPIKKIPDYYKKALGPGFLGSFTTFSTFSLEAINMLIRGEIISVFFYFFISLAGGLWLVQKGYQMGMDGLPRVDRGEIQ